MWILLILISVSQANYTKLVAQLGNPKFANRRAAHRQLYENIHEAAPYIQKYGIKSYDKEIQVRSKRLLTAYAKTIKPTRRYTNMPWIDMLPEDYPNRKEIIERTIEKISPTTNPRDAERDWFHSEATRAFVKELVFHGKSKKHIVELLDKMMNSQAKWIEEHVGEYPWLYNEESTR